MKNYFRRMRDEFVWNLYKKLEYRDTSSIVFHKSVIMYSVDIVHRFIGGISDCFKGLN